MLEAVMSELEVIQVEAQLADAVCKFHREQQGRGPESIQARLLPDMAIVRTGGIFTPTEKTLCGSDEGRKLIQSARREQRALTRREAEHRVSRVLSRPVLRSYYDLDVRLGEQVEVYILG
jgi:uncharacterized protein YbcI